MILARIPGRARSKLMRNECDPRSRRGYKGTVEFDVEWSKKKTSKQGQRQMFAYRQKIGQHFLLSPAASSCSYFAFRNANSRGKKQEPKEKQHFEHNGRAEDKRTLVLHILP